MTGHRYDATGDRLETDDATEGSGPSRRQLARKGRPVGGLRQNIEALGGYTNCCGRFVCHCAAA